MLTAKIGEVSDECPVLRVIDDTNYEDAQVIATYKIHDYSEGAPVGNTEYYVNAIIIDAVSIMGDPVSVLTDPLGNFSDPTKYYNDIIESVQNAQNTYGARLIMPDTSFRTWYLELFVYGSEYNGKTLTVDSPTLVPVTTDFTSSGFDIDFRNLSVWVNDEYIDLASIAQVDEIGFNLSSYTVGTVITINVCNRSYSYTVGESNTTQCIVAEIVKELCANKEFCDITFETDGINRITATASEKGVPFTLTATSNEGVDTITYGNITPNESNMPLPNVYTPDEYAFSPEERGGKYQFKLTVGAVCNSTTTIKEVYNWCFDKQSFDCCFNDLATKKKCDDTIIIEASKLRNIIKAIGISEANNANPSDTQKIVDYGWSICDPSKCGGCKKATNRLVPAAKKAGDCGCGCGGSGGCK
tara:strand:+ start:735 stop:1976 length:1242 start_codon:yes stop_codon:yes gene_type:complete